MTAAPEVVVDYHEGMAISPHFQWMRSTGNNEHPFIRQKFEAELAQRGQTSLMPDEAYTDPNYEWTYQTGEAAD